jgi:hypothetical protein
MMPQRKSSKHDIPKMKWVAATSQVKIYLQAALQHDKIITPSTITIAAGALKNKCSFKLLQA